MYLAELTRGVQHVVAADELQNVEMAIAKPIYSTYHAQPANMGDMLVKIAIKKGRYEYSFFAELTHGVHAACRMAITKTIIIILPRTA